MRYVICIFILLCATIAPGVALSASPVAISSALPPSVQPSPPSTPPTAPAVPKEVPGSFIDKRGVNLPIAPSGVHQGESVESTATLPAVVPKALVPVPAPIIAPQGKMQIAPVTPVVVSKPVLKTNQAVEKPKDIPQAPPKAISDLSLPQLPIVKEESAHSAGGITKSGNYSFAITIPKIILNLLPKHVPKKAADKAVEQKRDVSIVASAPISQKPASAIQAAPVVPKAAIVPMAKPMPVAPTPPKPAPVSPKVVPVVPPAAPAHAAPAMKTQIVQAPQPVAVTPPIKQAIAPNHFEKNSPAVKSIDKEMQQFADDEVAMLAVPDDDVLYGYITDEAKFDYMGYSQYLSIYQRYRDDVAHLSQFRANEFFIESHRRMDGHDTPILSDGKLFSTALTSIQYNRLDDLRVLANNYRLLSLVDNHGDSLLHLAAISDDVYLTKWLIMRGANINAMNDEGISAKDIAEYEQYWGVFNLLESSNAQ